MIQLLIHTSEGVVTWRLVKLRPAHLWRSQGSRYWERSGEVALDQEPLSDREALTAALTAILNRLGEREVRSGGGE